MRERGKERNDILASGIIGDKHRQKIKVLVIINPEPTSGADMMLLDAARSLDPDSFQVIFGLLTANALPAGALLPPAATIEFRLPGLNGLVWLRFFFHLSWCLFRNKINILHVNSYIPGNYARLAAWLLRVPIIIDHWHGFTRFNRKRRWICRFLDRGTDVSLTVSQGVRRHLLTELHLPPQKVRVLYNGIDLRRLQRRRSRAEVRAALGIPADVPLLGIVARLDHWAKGHSELFQALVQVRQRHQGRALVIGGGRRQPEMEALVRKLGLASWVNFLGHRDDIPDLLAALDIFVLPSHSEGVSRSLLEAMACGLPVVVSEAGGSPEVVQDGINGLLVPVKDTGALAAALERLLDNPGWARELGLAAAQRVAQHFSLDRLALELNEIYADLVKQKNLAK